MGRFGYAYLDHQDPRTTYFEVRVRVPSLRAWRYRRAWKKLTKGLPPGTNVTQIIGAEAFRFTGASRSAAKGALPEEASDV